MKFNVYTRILEEASYLVINKTTVRAVAKKFGVCKSTVHRDLTKLLPYLPVDSKLKSLVKEQLSYNKSVRSYRGGVVTAAKYLIMRSKD